MGATFHNLHFPWEFRVHAEGVLVGGDFCSAQVSVVPFPNRCFLFFLVGFDIGTLVWCIVVESRNQVFEKKSCRIPPFVIFTELVDLVYEFCCTVFGFAASFFLVSELVIPQCSQVQSMPTSLYHGTSFSSGTSYGF
jgi:hypothetical protein